jgi:serine/threonine protein kinase/tetratricopeptide (TPR) repeat protein
MTISLSEYEYLEAESSQSISTRIEEPQADILAGRLAEEMAAAWRRGDRPSAEVFLARHAELTAHPDAALRLIYEEVCLRQEAGETIGADEIARRYPRWASELRALFECHEVLQPAANPQPFPQEGEILGDFRLLRELGRGALGRVFLAAQRGLGDRLVVLKVTPRAGQEHLSLARLQHTHIVPLYAAPELPSHDLRLLCMPYLGGMTLARILEGLRHVPLEERTGQHLLNLLDRSRTPIPPDLPIQGPARRAFGRATYVEAVCLIGVCLAEALDYAHERHLVHLDVKPTNVLLAADGQPMLLDFHLAREPLAAGSAVPDRLGGTHAYMAPEQSAALAAVRANRPLAEAVTSSADIYTLGLLLYEALSGALPAGNDAPRLNRCNRRVSVGLADIIHKCLESAPAARYADAATLARDLRRHVQHLPLRGVANRSFRERWRKWRRRRPYALAFLVALLSVLSVGALAVDFQVRERRSAWTALVEGREEVRQGRADDAVHGLTRALERAERLPWGAGLTHALHGELERAKRASAVRDLHALLERLRLLYDTTGISQRDLRRLADRCQQIWETRQILLSQDGRELDPAVERDIRQNLLDLALLCADFKVRQASGQELQAAQKQALRVLTDAEAALGPSVILYREQQTFAEALGLTDLAAEAGRRADAMPAKTAWDHVALGHRLLRSGQLEQAQAEFKKALDLDPGGFWPNFYLGVCAYRREAHSEAFVSFHACVVLYPRAAECFYNRALVSTALDNLEDALKDYDRALKLDPGLAVAALNRGIVHGNKKNLREAIADFQRALELGADPAAVHYNWALVELARDDRSAALARLRRVLQHEPGHVQALALQEQLQREP